MSNIFSLIKESSIPSDIFSNAHSKEHYVESSIRLLESVNEKVEEKTKELYKSLAEAIDIKEENNSIKNFIAEIKQDIEKLSSNIAYMETRFAIALTNHCDSVKNTIKDATNMSSSFKYTDKFVSFNRASMLNPSLPNMNPHAIFEREFNFIAQLMQELPISASNKDKLNTVATVCDKFNSTMKNTTMSKMYADLFGGADVPESGLSGYITSLFRGNIQDKEISSDDFNEAVECINSCDEFINTISEMSDKLISDLSRIIIDLNNILACGDKNKFKVDTKEDGIRNTIYSVDTYTSNKIMWLAQEKINQIVNVYNKYILALSIKMECILSYVSQSSDIINSFVYITAVKPSDADDSESNGVEEPRDVKPDGDVDLGDTNVSASSDTEDDTEEDDFSTDDNVSGEDIDNKLDDMDDDLDTEDDVSEESSTDTDNDEPTPDFNDVEDYELKEAFMEFYLSLHEYSCVMHESNIIESAALLLEDGEQPAQNNNDNGATQNTDKLAGTKQVIGKVAEQKDSAWKALIKSMVKLWNKFKDNIVNNYDGKVKYLKENEKYIRMERFDASIDMPKIDHAKIDNIKIPDLNYQLMKNNLGSEKDFMNSQTDLKPFIPDGDGDSISQKVINSVISPNEKITNAKEINPQGIYDGYCKNFMSVLDDIKKMTSTIEKGQKNAEQIAKTVQESTNTNMLDMYFNEFKEEQNQNNTTPNNNNSSGNEEKKSSDVSTHLKVYFGVCGKILAAKMTVCQKVFNEYNAYLIWHINKKKAAEKVASNNTNNNDTSFN